MTQSMCINLGQVRAADKLTKTCSRGILCPPMILDNNVMVNLLLSPPGIHWPVSRDHITGLSLELIAD